MKPLTAAAALIAALALGACEPAVVDTTDTAAPADAAADAGIDAADEAPAPSTGVAVAADSEGLRLVNDETGSTRLLAFDSPREQTVTAIDSALGYSGEASTATECGSGATSGSVDYVNYEGGLSLMFIDDAFVGWTAEGPTISTMDGVAPGSTRAAIEESGYEFSESSLGLEANNGGIGVLLDDAGETAGLIFAGTNCFAR